MSDNFNDEPMTGPCHVSYPVEEDHPHRRIYFCPCQPRSALCHSGRAWEARCPGHSGLPGTRSCFHYHCIPYDCCLSPIKLMLNTDPQPYPTLLQKSCGLCPTSIGYAVHSHPSCGTPNNYLRSHPFFDIPLLGSEFRLVFVDFLHCCSRPKAFSIIVIF